MQTALFAPSPSAIPLAAPRPEHVAIASRLPAEVRLGTASWSYPGWAGTVYDAKVSPRDLANHGLTAYGRHPLLRAVEIDRGYYEPLSAALLRAFADQVGDDFRFVLKAHESCVVSKFSTHARYGSKRGQINSHYLDAGFATDTVIAPFLEGLGARGALVLFQFPPQEIGDPRAFAEDLHSFLIKLPTSARYAVEIRNAELLTPSYSAALENAGAVHCHNIWPGMPSVRAQARMIAPAARRPFLVRWLVRRGLTYETAHRLYAPFTRIVDEDDATHELVAGLVARAQQHGVAASVIVSNKAEGCAPKTVFRLAEAIVRAQAGA